MLLAEILQAKELLASNLASGRDHALAVFLASAGARLQSARKQNFRRALASSALAGDLSPWLSEVTWPFYTDSSRNSGNDLTLAQMFT